MKTVTYAELGPAEKNLVDFVDHDPPLLAPGAYRIQVFLARYPQKPLPWIGCWVYGRVWPAGSVHRLAIPPDDFRSLNLLSIRAAPLDDIEFAVTAAHDRHLSAVLQKVHPLCGRLMPIAVLKRWCEPLQPRGLLGCPFVYQKGGPLRVMVVGLKPDVLLDHADFTQFYDGVGNMDHYADRLFDLDGWLRFTAAANADGRPARIPFAAFRNFMGGRPSDNQVDFGSVECEYLGEIDRGLAPATVLYSSLLRFPARSGERTLLAAKSASDLTNEAPVFLEMLRRFRPDVVLTSGNQASRLVMAFLGHALGLDLRYPSDVRNKLVALGTGATDDVENVAVQVPLGRGCTSLFLPTFDLRVFDETHVEKTAVPAGYWNGLKRFLSKQYRVRLNVPAGYSKTPS